jgi:hypothetical protein
MTSSSNTCSRKVSYSFKYKVNFSFNKGDVLSSEEINTLEKNGKILKTRFDCVSKYTESLYYKLASASDELKKYKYNIFIYITIMLVFVFHFHFNIICTFCFVFKSRGIHFQDMDGLVITLINDNL